MAKVIIYSFFENIHPLRLRDYLFMFTQHLNVYDSNFFTDCTYAIKNYVFNEYWDLILPYGRSRLTQQMN